ncbi:Uncharacterised protein [Mycobacteroides abscessus subsp. abscessus]|nr:Uncharacterised protein [Mycobacteroides abscessus subsp. abscessus]
MFTQGSRWEYIESAVTAWVSAPPTSGAPTTPATRAQILRSARSFAMDANWSSSTDTPNDTWVNACAGDNPASVRSRRCVRAAPTTSAISRPLSAPAVAKSAPSTRNARRAGSGFETASAVACAASTVGRPLYAAVNGESPSECVVPTVGAVVTGGSGAPARIAANASAAAIPSAPASSVTGARSR